MANLNVTVFDMGLSRENLGQGISSHKMRAQRDELDNRSKDECVLGAQVCGIIFESTWKRGYAHASIAI